MKDAASTQEMFLNVMMLWAETNHRVMRDLVELGSGAARESVHLCTELQRSAIEATRESQAASLRWQTTWKEFATDPAAWYRKAVADGVTGAQQSFRMAEEGALAVTRAAERMQAATEAASKGIQETCSSAAAKLKELYTAA